MATVYQFHDYESMLSVANDPTKTPRAATKSLFMPDEDGDVATWDGQNLSEVEGHVVVYDPDTGTVFDVATDEYQPIQPQEFIGPLAGELSERDRPIEGTYRMFDGGRGYLEAVLQDSGIWPRDRQGHQEPVQTGVTVSWSHDGGVSVKARGFAQDGMCSNTMRSVSDTIYVKHAGDVEERVDWRAEWAKILDQLGAFSEALENVIDNAIDHTMFDLRERSWSNDWLDATDGLRKLEELDVPVHLTERDRDGINGFYDLLGFPGYICYSATDRAMWRLTQKEGDIDKVSAWDAYSALTWALTHQPQFDRGGDQDRRYHRTASDVLNNPPMAEEQAERELQRRLRPDEDDEALGIEEDVGEAARAYKEREARLREAINPESDD